jgi:hypothetical protein
LLARDLVGLRLGESTTISDQGGAFLDIFSARRTFAS